MGQSYLSKIYSTLQLVDGLVYTEVAFLWWQNLLVSTSTNFVC